MFQKFSRPTDKPEDKLSANAVREQMIKSKTCSYEAPQSITINKGAREDPSSRFSNILSPLGVN
jgi:GTPase Era involved in 16S rRNA processing